MQFGDLGINRKEKRRRHKTNGKDHVEDLKGSSEFLVYVPPNKDKKGYGDLRIYLESLGCLVAYAPEAPLAALSFACPLSESLDTAIRAVSPAGM